MAKTARRSLLSAIKQAQKEEAKLRKEQEKESRNYTAGKSKRQQSRYSDSSNLVQVASSQMPCIKCGNSNPSNSNFCVKCGSTLISNCSKCGCNSSSGSAFCNNCGFPLA